MLFFFKQQSLCHTSITKVFYKCGFFPLFLVSGQVYIPNKMIFRRLLQQGEDHMEEATVAGS